MPLMERCVAMADVEVAYLALDAARVEATATAEAAATRDLLEQAFVPVRPLSSTRPARPSQNRTPTPVFIAQARGPDESLPA